MKFVKLMLLTCLAISLTGCVDSPDEQESSNEESVLSSASPLEELPTVNSISGKKLIMEKYSLRLQLGETAKLVVDVLPEGYTAEDILFLSDNERSVTVDSDGTVTAMQSGAASIGVAIAGTSTRATVTVMVVT